MILSWITFNIIIDYYNIPSDIFPTFIFYLFSGQIKLLYTNPFNCFIKKYSFVFKPPYVNIYIYIYQTCTQNVLIKI